MSGSRMFGMPPFTASKALWWVALTLTYAMVALPSGLRIGAGSWHAAGAAMLGVALVWLSVEDTFTFRLPDAGTLPLTGAGLVWCAIATPGDLVRHAAAAALGFGALYLVASGYLRLRGQHGLGLGDAKLFSASGAWLGLEGLPSVLLIASVSGLVWTGTAFALGRRVERSTRLPFGPFLACATWIVWLYGPVRFGG
ncbi:MAG: A24 family peptidase [Hyphomicrobiaceae bacterium]